jgi:hypothetical protein
MKTSGRQRSSFRNEFLTAYEELKKDDVILLAGVKLEEIASRCLVGVSDLIQDSVGTKYEFTDEGEFRRTLMRDVGAGNQIYWREMLFRAHFAASAALLRTFHLVESMKRAWQAGDVYGLVNSFRFLVESGADTKYSLSWVPFTLANALDVITYQLSGNAREIVLNRELEDHLIHFWVARKLEKNEKDKVPNSHEARRTFEYINSLGNDNVKKVYGRLCQIGHPSAQSIAPFTIALDEDAGVYVFTDWLPGTVLAQIFDEDAQRAFEFSLMMGINYSHCIFTVLNALPEKRLHVPSADRFSQTSKAYAELKKLIRKNAKRKRPRRTMGTRQDWSKVGREKR